jgi:hypothetical protein
MQGDRYKLVIICYDVRSLDQGTFNSDEVAPDRPQIAALSQTIRKVTLCCSLNNAEKFLDSKTWLYYCRIEQKCIGSSDYLD